MIHYKAIDHIKGSQAEEILSEYMYDTHPRVCKHYNLDYDVDAMFEDDLENSDKYQPPKGLFLCAFIDDTPVGVGAFSQLDDSKAEIKRFYVRKKNRRQGIASMMLKMLIIEAQRQKYTELYLESSRFMTEAHALYRKFGFEETTLYEGACSKPGYEHAIIFMKKELD